MKKRISIFTSLLCVFAIITLFLYNIAITTNNNYERAKTNAVTLAETISSLYTGDNSISENFSENYRISIISANGTVIADSFYSDVSVLENHLNREEIQSALNGKTITVERHSETAEKDMIYTAIKTAYNDTYVFIRVAVTVESINGYVYQTLPSAIIVALITIGIAVALSVFFATILTNPLTKVKNGLSSISSGSFSRIKLDENDTEMSSIVEEINDVGEKLNTAMQSEKNEKNKLSTIINSINDAIVVFEGSDVEFVNERAKKLFDVSDEILGKSISALCGNDEIIQAVQVASSGTSSIFETQYNSVMLSVAVKQMNFGKALTLAVFSDITIERNNQKMRSEFFSNAGHELKTPLTAIIGFNELIVLDDKQSKYTAFTKQIASNSSRMLGLVEDMLKLEKLENSVKTEQPKIAVNSVIDGVLQDFSPIIASKKISVNFNGNAEIAIAKEHLYELNKNLIENAVKYNNDGGNVTISVGYTSKNEPFISVKDNGIGIDEKDVPRIFERFYRVEKSRSRATGGTGLGLSIVKHVCAIYNAKIDVKSRVGIGTTFTITFPVQN